MSINETLRDEMLKEVNRLDKRIEDLAKIVDDSWTKLSERWSEVHSRIAKMTTTINDLMELMRQHQRLFRRSMLWITSAFAAMHYDGTAEGLRLILGDPKEGAKPDEDSEPVT